MRKWIQKIRRSNHQTKKRWIIILSAGMMIVITIIWLANINSVFVSANETVAERSQSQFSTITIMKRGLAEISASVKNSVNSIVAQIISGASREKKVEIRK